MSKPLKYINYIFLTLLLLQFSNAIGEVETAYMFTQSPKIDGEIDDNWNKFKWIAIENILFSSPISVNDLSGKYKIAWKNDSLFILLTIEDDILDSLDLVNIYFDFGFEKNTIYDTNDFILKLFRSDTNYIFDYAKKISLNQNVTRLPLIIAKNYISETNQCIYEIGIDVKNFNLSSISESLKIGFNIELNDRDLNNNKSLIWAIPVDTVHLFYPGNYGTIYFSTITNPINIYYTKNDITSLGANTGSIDVTIHGGNPPYKISWSNGSTREDLFNISEGKYIITVTDILNNVATDTIDILNKSTSICYANNVSITPVIDGKIDEIWNLSKIYKIENYRIGNSSLSTEGSFQTLFNNGYLYFLIMVKDDNLFNNTDLEPYQRDHVNFYFDWGNEKTLNNYDENDYSLTYNWSFQDSLWLYKGNEPLYDIPLTIMKEKIDHDSNEYILEIGFDVEDWWGKTIDYTSNIEIGFDIKIGDEEIDNNYDIADIFWNSEDFTNSLNPSANGFLLINNGITIAYNLTHATNQNTYDGAIDITIHGGQPPYKYEWSTGDTTQDLGNCKIGFYNLIVTDNIGNIEYATITIGIYNIEPDDSTCSIKGHVLDDVTPINESMVILYKYQNGEYKAVASSLTNYQGIYYFDELEKGEYLLYAIPNSNDVNYYLPTYYVNNLDWQTAHSINLTGHAFNVDINLIKNNTLPDNEGIISGNVIYEDTSYYEEELYESLKFKTIKVDNELIRNPAPNIPIFLLESDFPVAWTLSNENGGFEFNKLYYSNYSIIAQKAGFEISNSVNLSITEKRNKYNNVMILIGNQKISSYLTENVIRVKNFPVPAKNHLTIDFENYSFSNFDINIYNSIGEFVKTEHFSGIYPSRFYILNILDLPSGVYNGVIKSENQQAQFRFSKIGH